MANLKVVWFDEYDCQYVSEVYCIDSVRDRFLVVNDAGNFVWVKTEDCKLEDSEDEYGSM
jgi:hypothetical protein